MLVQIDGNVIDTCNIWKIEQIYKNGAESMTFEISLFNKSSLFIGKKTKFEYNSAMGGIIAQEDLYMQTKEYMEVYNSVVNARSSLLEYWNKSNSSIPKIKI